MKLPKSIDGYELEIHKYREHYSVGYWKNYCLMKFHGGVLLFKAKKRKDAAKIMFDYLVKVGVIDSTPPAAAEKGD